MRKKLLIIGSGFSGLAAAIRLKQEGESDFLLLERSHEIGGVWRDNTYPGCACDVPSHLYSFSFAPNPEWSHKFARREEIHQYLKDCLGRFQLEEYIRFNHEMSRAEWNEETGEWRVETAGGIYIARFLILATGNLSEAVIPPLRGLETFSGEVFHSAHWPTGFSAKDRKVIVVGTGASAIQFIPQIAEAAKSVTIFQRTPAWILPRKDRLISSMKKHLFRKIPFLQKLTRLGIYLKLEIAVIAFLHPHLMKNAQKKALAHLHAQVPSENLRNKLKPKYTMGCKRILLSDDYYPALNKSNVSLVTSQIQEVRADGILDVQGTFYAADSLIFATGFKTQESPVAARVFSKGVSLSQTWSGTPRAYLGMMVSGFPNLFLMNGPNTGLGHSSMVYMYEAIAVQLLKAVEYVAQKDADILEVRSSEQDEYCRRLAQQMHITVWEVGGCKSWYLDSKGINTALWPDFSFSFRRLLKKFRPTAFEVRKSTKR